MTLFKKSIIHSEQFGFDVTSHQIRTLCKWLALSFGKCIKHYIPIQKSLFKGFGLFQTEFVKLACITAHDLPIIPCIQQHYLSVPGGDGLTRTTWMKVILENIMPAQKPDTVIGSCTQSLSIMDVFILLFSRKSNMFYSFEGNLIFHVFINNSELAAKNELLSVLLSH